VVTEELESFEREFGARESYPSVCSSCPDAQIIRHVHERRSLRRKMRMIQIHSQNSKSSAPGYCFEVSIPVRGVTVLCSFVTRGRSAALRRAAALDAAASSSLGVAGRERKKLYPRRDHAFLDRKGDVWCCATPDRHCGIGEVPISSLDIAAVGTKHKDSRKIPRIIFYKHLAASAEVSGKNIRSVSDFFEMDAVLQEPASCFGQEARPEGHTVRRQIKTQPTLRLLPDGQGGRSSAEWTRR
jgi:hypothetical protein